MTASDSERLPVKGELEEAWWEKTNEVYGAKICEGVVVFRKSLVPRKNNM